MSILYRSENSLKYKKDGENYLEKMILVDSELGLTFEYTKKNGENDFYKIETKLPKDGIYKVTEIINEKSEIMDINYEELLKLLKINKKLKFVNDYIKNERKKYIKVSKSARQKKKSKK